METEIEENSGASLNPAHKLGERLRENSEALRISRVPPRTKQEFKALAEDEFCGDYGMALKWLVDGLLTQDMSAVVMKLTELEERITQLEMQKNETLATPEPKFRKMLDGTKRIGGKE